MKIFRVLAVSLLILFVPVVGQTSSAKRSANQEWPSFWRRVTTAISRKDHSELLKVMPRDFFDGGGGLTAKEWLRYIDENERKGSWRDLQRSFALGTKISKEWSAGGTPTRVTKDNGYYFEFRADHRWYFAGIVGD